MRKYPVMRSCLEYNNFARFLRVPYLPGGRDREGCDCWGLVWLVYRHTLGINFPKHLVNAHDTATVTRLIEGQSQAGWARVEKPEPGDLALFTLAEEAQGAADHIGVLTTCAHMLHTTAKVGYSHMVRVDHPFYGPRLKGFYRYAG